MTDDAPDDAALLARAASGDGEAYRAFVARHADGVWRRALTLTQQRDDAEDLMQEAFLAAWRGAGTFRGGSARAWLLTIVGHSWGRMGRRAQRFTPVPDDETLEALAHRAGWGVATASSDDAEALVAEAFQRLGGEDRRLLALRDVDGVSGEETAEILGVSLAAMKSRLHRARLRLAAAYQEVRDAAPR